VTPWLVLAPTAPGRLDGIGDQSWQLARAMGRRGVSADLVVRTAEPASAIRNAAGDGPPSIETVSSWRALAEPSWVARAASTSGVVVNFFPPAYVRKDLPALLKWLHRVGAAGRPRILTIHELWASPVGSIRRSVLSAIHRRTLAFLCARVDHVVVTTGLAERLLREAGLALQQDVQVIPIGTNIDVTGRAAAGATPTIVMFGQPAGMHADTIAAVARWVAQSPRPVALCWLGRSMEEMQQFWTSRQLPAERVTFAGGLAAADVSQRLASAAIGLAPYVDGVSTRRSSFAALVAHRLPLVGLDAVCTDPWLRESGALLLSPLDAPDAFTANIERALGDPALAAALSNATAKVYETRLSWDRIADAYISMAASGRGGRA
jgi:glycosyltransferase involved in cell wall biosynthesis